MGENSETETEENNGEPEREQSRAGESESQGAKMGGINGSDVRRTMTNRGRQKVRGVGVGEGGVAKEQMEKRSCR